MIPLMIGDQRPTIDIARGGSCRYLGPVFVNPMTGTPNPKTVRSTSSHIPMRSFFSRVFYGGAVWGTFVCTGFLTSQFWRPAQRYRPSTPNDAGSSSTLGTTSMHTLIPSKIRALAHRRMALSALRANTALSVRLKRYNAHMDRARALESTGGAA